MFPLCVFCIRISHLHIFCGNGKATTKSLGMQMNLHLWLILTNETNEIIIVLFLSSTWVFSWLWIRYNHFNADDQSCNHLYPLNKWVFPLCPHFHLFKKRLAYHPIAKIIFFHSAVCPVHLKCTEAVTLRLWVWQLAGFYDRVFSVCSNMIKRVSVGLQEEGKKEGKERKNMKREAKKAASREE